MTRLVYILAASHSGSTLLAMLLGRHPEVCAVGELKATRLGDANVYRCSCGCLIRSCPFWIRVRDEMRGRGFEFDITRAGTDLRAGGTPVTRRLLKPLHRGRLLEAAREMALFLTPGWREHLTRVQQINAALAETLVTCTGRPVVVDSSKIATRLKYLLRNPRLDVRVVRLVRDGRGVALTYTDPARFADARDPALKGGGSGASRDADRLTMSAAAREWRRSNQEAEALLRRLEPSRWTEVRYEEICSAPIRTLRRLFEFIGVDPDATSLDFRSVDHHVVGNGMRLDATDEIRLDERWQSVLTTVDLATFATVAGDLNRRLGYS